MTITKGHKAPTEEKPKVVPKIRLIIAEPPRKNTAPTLKLSAAPSPQKTVSRAIAPTTEEPSLISYFTQQMGELKRQRGQMSSTIFEKVFGHKDAPTIDIGSVLAHFDNTVDEHTSKVMQYEIMFLAISQSTGNAYVREMLARKNVKSPKRQMAEKNERGKQMHNLKYAGTMLLYDEVSEGPRSVKVRMIFAFRMVGSKTWCRVADRSGGWGGVPGKLVQTYRQEDLNDLYHSIDDFQPKIQESFNKIRSLENTGKLPEEKRVDVSRELDALKYERKRLNDKISKTRKKLNVSAKPSGADRVLQWQTELAEAEATRYEIEQKIKSMTP
tara:strand:- start:30565 stop:31548 length:984 start_codon:yes stop_codon:yes gene_type:complete